METPLKTFILDILALNTYKGQPAYLITLRGDYKKLEFEYGYNTEVYFSCLLQWKNEYYLFGGLNEERQVSMVNANRLERKGSLDFSYRAGGCTVLSRQTIVLCFDWDAKNVCRKSNSPLGSFNKLPNTNYNHYWTTIASVNGKNRINLSVKAYKLILDTLIAVGDFDNHAHTELFTLSNPKWQIKNDYHFSKDIYGYSILAFANKFIIFGGLSYKRKTLTNTDIKNMKILFEFIFIIFFSMSKK